MRDESPPASGRSFLAAGPLSLALLAGGCTLAGLPPAPPPVLEASGAAAAGRSLEDAGLRGFLAKNLGRDPVPADGAWDFNALTWAAFYFHPGLDVARAQWEVARAAQATAAARPNPTLTLTPGYNFTGGPESPWFPALAADLPVETGGKRAARTDAARLDSEAARQELFAAAWRIRGELRQALAELQTAEQRLVILRRQVAAQESISSLVEQRRQAGTATAPEAATARVALLQARASLADTGRQLPVARQKVAEALGLPVSALDGAAIGPLPVAAAPADAALAAARQVSLRSRADVLAALARYDATRAAFTAEAAKRYPDIHFGPSYQWDQGASKWSLGLTLELPVFNRNEGPLAEALAKARQAAADFNAVQTRVIAEIDRAVAAQSGASALIASLSGVEAELARRQQQLQLRLAAGGADQLELQSGRLELAAAELALVDARAQAVAAAGQLEDALQVPFADLSSLAPVNAASSP
jgi:cobalt-zinc-cadmium efflux system outer membrane protein